MRPVTSETWTVFLKVRVPRGSRPDEWDWPTLLDLPDRDDVTAIAVPERAWDVARHSVPEVTVPADADSLPTVLHSAKLASSGSEARRLIAYGQVRIDGERCTDPDVDVSDVAGSVVEVSRSRYARIAVEQP